MSIGKEFAFEKISRKSFQAMAVDCKIRPEIVMAQIEDITSQIIPVAEALITELSEYYFNSVYSDIFLIIRKNVEKLSEKI